MTPERIAPDVPGLGGRAAVAGARKVVSGDEAEAGRRGGLAMEGSQDARFALEGVRGRGRTAVDALV